MLLIISCHAQHADVAPTSGDPNWPMTRGEAQGQTYLADPTMSASKPCTGKTPIELRLYTTDLGRTTLRLAARNCTPGELRFLHDGRVQPSELSILQNGKSIAPFDDRTISKFDTTVYAHAFIALAPGEERVLEEGYFVLEGGKYSLQWLSFHFDIARGSLRVEARFASALADGMSEGKRVKVSHAWLGSASSNALAIDLP